jgi:hypothetical protein
MITLLMFLMAGAALIPQSEVSDYNIPDRIETCLKPVANQYKISGRINPFYLSGDFDGDGRRDYAVIIINRKGERGIAVCRAAVHKPEIIGAGVVLNKLVDFDFDAWMVFERGALQRGIGEGPPPKLQSDGISIIWSESASAILYWDGIRFRWYQQGD